MAYNLHGIFNAKVILLDEQSWYYLTYNWQIRCETNFSRVLKPKMNVLAKREVELTYCDVAVRHITHYATRIPSSSDGDVYFLPTDTKHWYSLE